MGKYTLDPLIDVFSPSWHVVDTLGNGEDGALIPECEFDMDLDRPERHTCGKKFSRKHNHFILAASVFNLLNLSNFTMGR